MPSPAHVTAARFGVASQQIRRALHLAKHHGEQHPGMRKAVNHYDVLCCEPPHETPGPDRCSALQAPAGHEVRFVAGHEVHVPRDGLAEAYVLVGVQAFVR